MTTGTWIVNVLTLSSGLALLAAVVRTWYWKRGHGNGLRTRAILFAVAVTGSLVAMIVPYSVATTTDWAVWTLIPAAISAAAAVWALFRDRPQPEAPPIAEPLGPSQH